MIQASAKSLATSPGSHDDTKLTVGQLTTSLKNNSKGWTSKFLTYPPDILFSIFRSKTKVAI